MKKKLDSYSEDESTPKFRNWRALIPGTDKRTDRFHHRPIVDDLKNARMRRKV